MRIEKGKEYLMGENKPTPSYIHGLLDEEFVKKK
jgi:hypothetical protein